MIPLVLVAAGAVAVAAGWLAMRRIGPGARIGRILASTPVVPIAAARRLAEEHLTRYVAVAGRLDSEAPFEDEHGRPLVLRRSWLELAAGSGWRTIEDHREVVPFGLSEGLDTIAVDGDALDDGLVVVRRQSDGTAGEIPDRVPAGTPASTPVRMRLALLTTVDHAVALGVPVLDGVLGPVLRPGLGRPLIVSTLESGEAMRVLAADRRGAARLATALLAAGVVLLVAGLGWTLIAALAPVATVLAASPSPSEALSGDPRSSGQGPGLVGDPAGAIAGVLLVAAAALALTLLYVRATGGRRER